MAKIPDIKIKFSATGAKGLNRAIKSLDRSTKSLINSQARIVASNTKQANSNKKLGEGLLATNHSTRILGGSFAVLRSKMLLASFGAGLFAMTLGKLVKAQAEQEKSEKKLSTALGKRSQELLNFASQQQQVTTFGDEETITAMSLVGAYTNNEQAIKKLTKASMDLAVAKGMDLNSAVDLVAKSVFSSTNALSRYGVVIEGSVGSTERLEMATEALAQMYGGQALAEAETMSGAIKQMGNALGDTAEVMGEMFAPFIKSTAIFIKEATERFGTFISVANNTRDALSGLIGHIGDLTLEYFGLKTEIKETTNALVKHNAISAYGEIILKLEAQKSAQLALIDAQKKTRDETKTGIGLFDAWIGILSMTGDALNDISKENIEEQFNTALAKLKEQALAAGFSLKALNEELTRLKQSGSGGVEIDEFEVFLAKQRELVRLKEQEAEFLDKIRTIYPELAKSMGLMDEEAIQNKKNMEKLANFASQTATSLMVSAAMGDDMEEALKRAVLQLMIMVAQAKLFDMFMTSATGGTNKITSKIAGFLFPFGHDGGAVTKNGIKRFHSGGLASDETPAILQQGEFVLSKNAVQSIGLESARAINEGRGGRGIQIHIHGGVVQEDYITNELIPAINKAKALA
jgi:hypothetical protein